MDAGDKENIEKAIEDLKNTLKNDNADASEIKTKLEALNTASMKLGEMMYKQNPQSQGTESEKESASDKGPNENEAKDENIVDADFEEVDEDTEKKK